MESVLLIRSLKCFDYANVSNDAIKNLIHIYYPDEETTATMHLFLNS